MIFTKLKHIVDEKNLQKVIGEPDSRVAPGSYKDRMEREKEKAKKDEREKRGKRSRSRGSGDQEAAAETAVVARRAEDGRGAAQGVAGNQEAAAAETRMLEVRYKILCLKLG